MIEGLFLPCLCLLTVLCLISRFIAMTFLMPPSGLDPWKPYSPGGILPVFKNCFCTCILPGWTIYLCLSTSSLPTCWKYSHIQPVLQHCFIVIICNLFLLSGTTHTKLGSLKSWAEGGGMTLWGVLRYQLSYILLFHLFIFLLSPLVL